MSKRLDPNTVGDSPAEVALIKILNEIPDEKERRRIAHHAISHIQRAHRRINRLVEYIPRNDDETFRFVLALVRDQQLRELDECADRLPDNVYTHTRCSIVTRFRAAKSRRRDDSVRRLREDLLKIIWRF